MLLAGDEFGRTQHGNNNAYCQDNDISWFDWTIGRGRAESTRLHQTPDQAAPRLSDPAPQPLPDRAYDEELGVNDVTWINASGGEMTTE